MNDRIASNRNQLASKIKACLIMLLFTCNLSKGALVINLNFDDTNAPADGSAILGGSTRAQARNVIEAAASYWTTAFANSSSSASWAISGTITQTINVTWSSISGSTLATGGTSFFGNGAFAGGTLTFDNDGTSNFFVDSDPFSNDEWRQSSTRSQTFDGVSMNVERVSYDAPAGIARDNSDMMTVAIHEIGHALGFLGGYPGFSANVSGGVFTVGSGPFAGADIPVVGGHTNFQILTPSVQFPYDASPGSFVQQNYYPNVLGPSIFDGVRLGLTEVDIAILAQTLQFDMNTVNYNPMPIPEPGSLCLAVCAFSLWLGRRRRI